MRRRGLEVLEDLRAARRPHATRREHVLDGERDSSHSARIPFLASTASARSSASPGVVVTKALTPSSTSSTRVLATSAASRAETSPPSISLRARRL